VRGLFGRVLILFIVILFIVVNILRFVQMDAIFVPV